MEKNRRIRKFGIKFLAALAWPFIGYLFDFLIGLFPLFTILGSIAGFAQLFIETRKEKTIIQKTETWPVIECSVEDIRNAVRIYSDQLPKGVYRTILVKDDHSIDAAQLATILKGTPSRNFYMSKETYDIFDESDKNLAITIDKVQKAVDLYVKEYKEYPMLPYDPLNRVNYYQLLKANCLDAKPDIDLYITNYDGLVTHKMPKKQNSGN